MIKSMRRRDVVLSMGAVSAAALLAACSQEEKKPAADATPAAPATPATEAAPAKPAVAAPAAQGKVDVAKLMAPGTLPDQVMGKADAPVTIVEYASLTCSHCRDFHEASLPEIKAKYIDTGKARLILREFPFDPRAEAGFMLARCSKDRYFPMTDVLFKQQDSWARADDAQAALLQISKLAGFTQESFTACLTDQKLLDDIRAVRERGNKEFGVDATPTFFINGNKYAGALSAAEMSAIIDGML